MRELEAVILVGHGGVPKDVPRELVAELKQLERDREHRGESQMSAREAELDRTIREWPRTAETDPYKAGLEAIAARMEPLLGGRKLVVAYNEFCAPSLADAVAELVREDYKRITIVTTMVTPGGSHSEFELPAEVTHLQATHPEVEIRYAWPYALEDVARFFAAQVTRRGTD